jgi:hypothetical protein
MTSRELLALKPGAIVVVTLRGAATRVRLLGNPWIEAAGQPGIGRVRFEALDFEHAKRLDAWEERQGPGYRGRFAGTRNPAKHTINGKNVLSIE